MQAWATMLVANWQVDGHPKDLPLGHSKQAFSLNTFANSPGPLLLLMSGAMNCSATHLCHPDSSSQGFHQSCARPPRSAAKRDRATRNVQNVVRRWAVASDVDVIFAENSGADLSTIEAVVPPWRRHNFEFVSVPYTPERLPPRGRPDVGRIEAGSIVYALNTSKLLAARCPHDIVFGVTSRYFVHDFEQLVRGKCLKGRRQRGKGGNAGRPPHSSGLPLPRVLVQNPVWRDKSTERHSYERETSILGFAASYAFEVFSWCVAPVPEKFEEYAHYSIGSEVHLGKLIKRMQDAGIADDYVCDLPSLPIMPVKEEHRQMESRYELEVRTLD